jgi:hypothetical protein
LEESPRRAIVENKNAAKQALFHINTPLFAERRKSDWVSDVKFT